MTPVHCQSAGPTISMGGLSNSHLFLTVLEAGQFKIKPPAHVVPGLSSWLADSCLLAMSLHGREGEREREGEKETEPGRTVKQQGSRELWHLFLFL